MSGWRTEKGEKLAAGIKRFQKRLWLTMAKRFTIRIEPYGKEVSGSGEETVLDALRRQFYGRDGQPAFPGCRRGGCAYCKAELLAGEVHHHHIYSRAALSDEERSKRFILTCQSRPISDLSILLQTKK